MKTFAAGPAGILSLPFRLHEYCMFKNVGSRTLNRRWLVHSAIVIHSHQQSKKDRTSTTGIRKWQICGKNTHTQRQSKANKI